MICKNCGKENADGSKFCAHCGQTFEEMQTENVNTARDVNATQNTTSADFIVAQYGKQNTTPEIQEYLQHQKTERVKKAVLKREKASSLIWLISGILQCLMFARFTYGFFNLSVIIARVYNRNLTDCLYTYMPPVAVISFRIAMLITAISGIKLFLKRKSKKQIVNLQQKTTILIFASQIIIYASIALWDVFPFPHCYSETYNGIVSYFSAGILEFGIPLRIRRIIEFFTGKDYWQSLNFLEDFSTTILLIINILPVISSLLDVINATIVKKNKAVFETETDNAVKSKKAPLKIISVVICVFVAVALIFTMMDMVFDKIRYNDENKLENKIKYGHLDGYNEKMIGDAIKDIAENECKGSHVSFYFEDNDPYKNNEYLKMDFPLTKEQKRLRYMQAYMCNLDNNDKKHEVSLTFMVDNFADTIFLYNLNINGEDIVGDEESKFIKKYFSINSELYTKGEYYTKYGK